MLFFRNLKKLFKEEILTESDFYTKEESDDRYVEAHGDSKIDGNLKVKSITTNSNLEIY